MTPFLSESNESEIFDLEPVWPYSTEGNGRRYCKLYIFLKLIDSRLRPYMFQNNLSHFNFHPCTNFTPLFQGHVGETHFGRQNIRIQHIYIDKDKVVASFYVNLLLDWKLKAFFFQTWNLIAIIGTQKARNLSDRV